jgi:hypothetical protein
MTQERPTPAPTAWPRNAAGADERLIGDDAPADVEAAPPPPDATVKTIAQLARQQVELLREKDQLETRLEEVQRLLFANQTLDLPAAMAQAGVTGLNLAGGHALTTSELVTAAQPKDRVDESNAWLEAHGHGGLVKRQITILFGRGDEAWARTFLAQCARRRRPLDLSVKRFVHPQTLGAFVREQLKLARQTGADPEALAPSDLLGVFRLTRAEVTGPSVPKPRKKRGGRTEDDA